MHLNHLPPETLAERIPGISLTAKTFAGAGVIKGPAPGALQQNGTPINWNTQVIRDETNAVVPGLSAPHTTRDVAGRAMTLEILEGRLEET